MTETSRTGSRGVWATTAAVITNVAVLVGLAFVIVELQQNERNLAADVQLSLASAYQDLSSRPIENPDFAATLTRMFTVPDSLSQVEFVQALNWMNEWAAVLFATYELRRSGVITTETWEQHAKSFALFLDNEWFRERFVGNFSVSYPEPFIEELVAFSRPAPSQ